MTIPTPILRWPLDDGTWRSGGDSTFDYARETITDAQDEGTPATGSGTMLRACPGALVQGMRPKNGASVWLSCSGSLQGFTTESFSYGFYLRVTMTDGAPATEDVMAMWHPSTSSARHYKIQKISETNRYKLRFAYWNGSTTTTVIDSDWIDTDRFEWHYFVLRRSTTYYTWFIDGVSAGNTSTGPATLLGSGGSFYIFSDGSSTDAMTYGALEMLEVWDEPLDAAEVQELADRAKELDEYQHRQAVPGRGALILSRMDGDGTAITNVAPDRTSRSPSATSMTTRAAPSNIPCSYMREFNGSSSYVSYGTTGANIQRPTVIGWWIVDDDDIGATDQVLVSRYDDSPNEGYKLYIENNTLYWVVVEDTDQELVCECDLLGGGTAAGELEHGPFLIMATCNDYKVSLFVNGHLADARDVNSTPLVVDYDQTDTPVTLGRAARSSAEFFDGAVADFLLADEPIPCWEQWSLWTAFKNPAAGLLTTATLGNPVAVYNYNETGETASVVKDSVGNHDGAVTGTVDLVNVAISDKGRAHDGSTSNYITISHHADFSVDQDFSWVSWVQFNDVSTLQTLISKGDLTTGPTASLQLQSSSDVAMKISTDSSNYLLVVGKPLTNELVVADRLYMITVTFSQADGKIRLFFDDHPAVVTTESETGSYTGGDNTKAVQQGVAYDTPLYPLDADMLAWAWYPRVLEPVEVFNLYRAANLKVRA